MNQQIEAPWTDGTSSQVPECLPQACAWHHPFTCGEREPDGTHHALVATSEGWHCLRCFAER